MNIERHRRVIEAIKDNLQEWDQTSFCGTACCYAGWAQKLSVAESGTGRIYMTIAEDARKWLQLSYSDSRYLFHSARTLEELESYVEGQAAIYPFTEIGGYSWWGTNADGKYRDGSPGPTTEKEVFESFGLDSESFDSEGFDLGGLNRQFESRTKGTGADDAS